MKKKLLIINGAGASVEFGMPSVKEIDKLFSQWSNDYCKLVNDANENLYDWVKAKTNEHFISNKITNNIDNFENHLYTMALIESALTNSNHWLYFSNKLKPFIDKFIELPKIDYFNRNIEIVNDHHFSFLQSYLIDNLLSHFRRLCIDLENSFTDEQLLLKKFYKDLQREFDIGIYNLNYDNVIIRNVDNLKTGFSEINNQLDRNLLHSDDWNFCYHIHGSVHFDMKGGTDNTQMHKINWNGDLKSLFSQNSSGRSSQYTSEGIIIKTSSIIAGLGKTNQLLREPFMQYYMTLDKNINEADAILFLGYGFSDLHFNALFEFIRFNQIKNRKVVVVDYANKDTESFQFRQDSWSNGVQQALPFNHYELEKRHIFDINEFRLKKDFERNSNAKHHIAIWYNGFIEACKNSNKIIQELS